MSRLQPLIDKLTGLESPEDTMLELMSVLDDMEIVPEPGQYYTFLYTAKTPNIRYDQHPLIACTDVEQWGFRGFNFHWGTSRNYTWGECQSQLYLIKPNEIKDARSLSYASFKMSS